LRIWHAGGVIELDLVPHVAEVTDRLAALLAAVDGGRSRSHPAYP
jgi:hypothetical protein